MPEQHNFEHLPLLLRHQGRARLQGGGSQSPQTRANKNARQAHSDSLRNASQSLTANWEQRKAQRQEQALPVIPQGIPILLQVDPSLDLDVLRDKFSFEIVAEQEEGYVIVASEDIELAPFLEMVNGFAVQVHGSATVASVHRLFDDPDQTDRLRRILSDFLFTEWPRINDAQPYVVDIGIACAGTQEIPSYPNKGKRDCQLAAGRNARSGVKIKLQYRPVSQVQEGVAGRHPHQLPRPCFRERAGFVYRIRGFACDELRMGGIGDGDRQPQLGGGTVQIPIKG
jgi:hypothetical protein